jgi:hypothetical protein
VPATHKLGPWNVDANTLRKESALLLSQFEKAAMDATDPQARGYLLKDLLNRTFDLHGLPPTKAFTRNDRPK